MRAEKTNRETYEGRDTCYDNMICDDFTYLGDYSADEQIEMLREKALNDIPHRRNLMLDRSIESCNDFEFEYYDSIDNFLQEIREGSIVEVTNISQVYDLICIEPNVNVESDDDIFYISMTV